MITIAIWKIILIWGIGILTGIYIAYQIRKPNPYKINTKVAEDNPFKHFRAIPSGPLPTNTLEKNPFLKENEKGEK